ALRRRRRLDPPQGSQAPPRQSRLNPYHHKRSSPPSSRRTTMSDSTDPLAQLIATPLVPLPERWIVPSRVEQLAHCRSLPDADAYWEWVAQQQRWSTPWSAVRTGEFDGFQYFVDGRINVADNCVDRWAEDPATADRVAVIWEG